MEAQGDVPPGQPSGPWSPPGIETPWPKSEYVRDGGHVGAPLTVNRQGQVRGLQMEDTVAQYETLDGQSHVQPSNPVYLYAPRFGAVRQVTNLQDEVQIDRLRSVHDPVKLSAPTIRTLVTTGQQDLQVGDDIGMQPASIFHAKQGYGAVSNVVGPRSFQDRYKAFENLSVVRVGKLKESEAAWLARGNDAAAVWTNKQAVQVLLEHRAAVVDSSVEKLGTVYTNDLPPTPRLRIVKLASTSDAKPGETVDFTIRFDNLGLQAIGSVVILDSLSTRLEFVPASAQCSLEARVLDAAQRRRLAHGALRVAQSAEAGPGRRASLPVPRAVGRAHLPGGWNSDVRWAAADRRDASARGPPSPFRRRPG